MVKINEGGDRQPHSQSLHASSLHEMIMIYTSWIRLDEA